MEPSDEPRPDRAPLGEALRPLAVGVGALLATVLVAGTLQSVAVRWLPSLAWDGTGGTTLPAGVFLFRAITTELGMLVPTIVLLRLFPGTLRLAVPRSALPLTAAAIVGVILLNFAGSFALEAVGERYSGMPELPTGLGGAIAVLACTVALAPIVEELCFREALLARVFRRSPRSLGLAATSLGFGVLHAGSAGPVALASLCLIGLALGLVRERTDSTGAAIVVHAANNGFAWIVVGFGSGGAG